MRTWQGAKGNEQGAKSEGAKNEERTEFRDDRTTDYGTAPRSAVLSVVRYQLIGRNGVPDHESRNNEN